jgi:hypothetical protein
MKHIYLLLKGIKTIIHKYYNKSDYKTWGNENNLKLDWAHRTQVMAQLIPNHSKVIEFGAGRMFLKDYLPLNCSYVPSDLVKRSPETIICDLNSLELPTFSFYDIAFFSGVIEYINNVPKVIKHLSPSINSVIVSYATYDLTPKYRRVNGWVNDYTLIQFINLFAAHGFVCQSQIVWKQQIIFYFVKQPKI